MSIADVSNLFTFCGGLGMFLYGMHVMSDGIQRSAGEKMKNLLGILTNNRLTAVLVGALITAIIQSSGATTVMVVGFVNAGLMTLTQVVGVIMGANIGTCITAWIVSMESLGDAFKAMSPTLYAPLIICIGAFLIMFSKKNGRKDVGNILIGLGLLFLGLDFMKNGAGEYTDLPIFTTAFQLFSANPILGIAIGMIVTAIMQSSSAAVGILQMLASTGGVVTAASAIYISLGSNIGSCVTALLSSMGTTRNAKRTAVMHLTFNIVGTILFGTVLYIVFLLNQTLRVAPITSVGISIFHTVFNIICTILLFPFANVLVKISDIVVPKKEEAMEQKQDSNSEENAALRHLDKRILESPAFAVEAASREVVHMGEITLQNTRLALEAITTQEMDMVQKVYENEKTINNLEKMLTEYLVKVNNLSLTDHQHLIVSNLFYTVNDIERVGDHTENIAEQVEYMINNQIHFSETGKKDIQDIGNTAAKAFAYSIECREKNSKEALRKVINLEDDVDTLEEDLRAKHIQRLSAGECDPSSGVVFLDIIGNLERISDHATNIVGYVRDEL
ncbi:MAG TPA: Na/Pi cotransporter family protein [Candidatus Fimimorpha faecalis]|uniref:Na/Pi cotransporter family protein n=1 Tax=Candidatus Fimimorpha faecalis TaxID=2840824 RepID=A0A9D1JBZ2_9FIRM|nr:Na/Pi cotransporter family protein [Candidatus Fimimorpha faecalis]